MASMAIILTLLTLLNLAAAYLYFCQKALERSLTQEKTVWPAIIPLGERNYGMPAMSPLKRKAMNPKPAPKKATTKKPAAKKPAARKPRATKNGT